MGKRNVAGNYFEIIFEEHPDILFIVDSEGKILQANQAAVKAYGYKAAEMKTLKLEDLLYPELQNRTKINQWARGSFLETFHRRKDGSRMPVEIKSRGVKMGLDSQIVVAIREILTGQPNKVADSTGKKTAELSQSRALSSGHGAVVNQLVESLDLVFFHIDTEMKYTAFNHRHADNMRRRYGANIAAGGKFLDYVTISADRDVMGNNMRRVFSGEMFVFEHWFNMEDKDGECLEVIHCPIRNENKQIVGASVFAHEVTERKAAQELLQASEYRYRKLVEDSGLIILQLNDQGEIQYLNEFGCEFFEYSLAEIVGKRFDALFSPAIASSQRTLREQLSCIFRQKSTLARRVTSELMTHSQKRVWVDWSYHWSANQSETELNLIAAGVDMTRVIRARMEEQNGYRRRHRQELMNEAIGKKVSQEEFLKLTYKMDIPLSSPLLCLLLHGKEQKEALHGNLENEEKQRQMDLLIDWLHRSGVGIVWQTTDGIGIFGSLSGENKKEKDVRARKTAMEVLRQVLKYAPRYSWQCGVSQASPSNSSVSDLYSQAQAALLFGPSFLGHKAFYHWSDFGNYQLLIKDIRSENTMQFIDSQLGPLLQMEKNENRVVLFNTLREIITLDPLEKIAQRLHVHRGTVRYRRKALEKLLDSDFDSMESV